jgi:hypothetical protein
MIACGESDESDESDGYLPIVKMLLNHPKIEINQPNKVIIIESISWFLLVFNFIDSLYCRMVGQHCIMLLILIMY